MAGRWEVFKREAWSPSGVTASIHAGGTIALTNASARLLAPARRVDLLFDPERRVVGLRPSDADTAFVLSKGRYVDGREFIEHFEIPWRSMRFPVFLHDGVLCFDVSVEGQPITRGRPRE